MLPECPHCHIATHSSKAQYCPRCGGALNLNSSKPIMLEKQGTLLNAWFGASLIVVLAGAWLASMGHLRVAAIAFVIGVPLMIFATIRGHSHK